MVTPLEASFVTDKRSCYFYIKGILSKYMSRFNVLVKIESYLYSLSKIIDNVSLKIRLLYLFVSQ